MRLESVEDDTIQMSLFKCYNVVVIVGVVWWWRWF